MVTKYDSLPESTANDVGKMIFFEAVPGMARRTVLQQWLQRVGQQQETIYWFLSCDFNEGGVWAGVQDLVQDLVPLLEQRAPTLLEKHSYELCLMAPALRRRIRARYSTLTDMSVRKERVRNFSVDRIYRSLHGIIDLLGNWYTFNARKPIVIVCDHFEQAPPLVQRFFMELLRRKGQELQLTLLLAVAPGQSSVLRERYPLSSSASLVQLNLPADPEPSLDKERIAQTALELEQQIKQDPVLADIALPQLITLLEQSEQIERALYWKVEAVNHFNHLGIYETGLRYSEEIEAHLGLIDPDNHEFYQNAVMCFYFCYISLGYVERAYEVMATKIINHIQGPYLSHVYYLMAMLYARFLPQRDLLKALDYLEQGLALINDAHLPEDEHYFHTVFLNNGIAYVLAQQKRPEEAIALCREGFELLNQHLSSGQHQLHRSILMYNITQVYVAIQQFDSALATFEVAIRMDPNYSEYYNERGNVYMRIGRLAEAEQDYLRAIELSPPYAEVWINLGQCYREMGKEQNAIAAYTRALDLDPTKALPLIGRAEMYGELGCWKDALTDYHAALQLEPQAPLVLAARAIAFYESGQVEQAFADLDAAVALSPDTAVFYQNRARALIDLGHKQRAAEDLRRYLQLQPDADDASEVEQQIVLLAYQ